MEALILWLLVPAFAVLDWFASKRPGRRWFRIVLAAVEVPFVIWVVYARLNVVGIWWLALTLVLSVVTSFRPEIERALARLRGDRRTDGASTR